MAASLERLLSNLQRIGVENNIQQSLSQYLVKSLQILQSYDRHSNKIRLEILSHENELKNFLRIKAKKRLASEIDSFDESVVISIRDAINLKRMKLAAVYEYQMKIVQNCYDVLDKRIGSFGMSL